jgi:hypothetical protein
MNIYISTIIISILDENSYHITIVDPVGPERGGRGPRASRACNIAAM